MGIVALSLTAILWTTPSNGSEAAYRYGPASRDGIGKFYEGREISQVMGHLGAGWLERKEREREERPMDLIRALELNDD
ncbi:MAG: SAM-dependent methyltransferase, partial [Myxococcota bacterium]